MPSLRSKHLMQTTYNTDSQSFRVAFNKAALFILACHCNYYPRVLNSIMRTDSLTCLQKNGLSVHAKTH
jgi:hypothetical protein